MRTKGLLLAVASVWSLAAAIAVNAQKPLVVKGGEFCEGYLLKKAARDKAEGIKVVKLKSKEPRTDGMGVGAENSPIVKLGVFKTDNQSLSESLGKWLGRMDVEHLSAFELRHKGKRALALRSVNPGRTGLATSFQSWHIRSDNHSVEFISLAENSKLIFWDEDGLLNYYSVYYSDEFVETKDWDNVTFDLLRYRVSPDGKPRLVSEEQNVKCE
jgi:hypothetical protein